MGILQNIFGRRDTTFPPDQLQVGDVLLKAILSGETITREKALTVPAVSGAVDFICNAVASMPVKLYKVKDGKVEEQPKDTRVKLLNGDTGDTLDAFQMKKAMVEDYLLGKGGYCYIRRDRNDVTGLFYVEEQYISVIKNYEPIYKDYDILVLGQNYKPWDFVKLLRNTKDGASGIGLTVEVSKALETAYTMLVYQLMMAKTGGNKKGFLKSERRLGQEEINVLKDAWRKMYGGDNSENVVVLNNGLEFQEASNTSVEMQLNESKRTLNDEINDIFHISPNDFELTFKLAIYPIIKAFETALNRDLLLEKEKKNHFFEFDVKEIIKASINERYSAYKTAKETGFMTLNEIRRSENMNYVEGLDVVNVGLGAVLYDVNKHVYYTPNTDTVGDINDGGSNETEAVAEENKMLENHELAQAYDESGNSAERSSADGETRENKHHDPKTGRFTFAPDSPMGMIFEKAKGKRYEEWVDSLSRDEKRLVGQNIKDIDDIDKYWRDAQEQMWDDYEKHEISIEDAEKIISENIPDGEWYGWFKNADSNMKPRIEERIVTNPELRNAGLSLAYQIHNGNLYTGLNNQNEPVSFDEFLNMDMTLFRGDKDGKKYVADDTFLAFTPNIDIATGFGKNITTISVKPIETYGVYRRDGENEYFVPTSIIEDHKRAETNERGNKWHDPKTGKFTTGPSGGETNTKEPNAQNWAMYKLHPENQNPEDDEYWDGIYGALSHQEKADWIKAGHELYLQEKEAKENQFDDRYIGKEDLGQTKVYRGSDGEEYREFTGEAGVEAHNPDIAYWENIVDSREQSAVQGYTAMDYEDINKIMNGYTEDYDTYDIRHYQEQAEIIDGAIRGTTSENMIVYRGIDAIDPDDLDVGDKISTGGITSTSFDKDVADDFAGDGALIQIEVPSGTRALLVGSNSQVPNEGEVIFGLNTTIEIVGKYKGQPVGRIYYND